MRSVLVLLFVLCALPVHALEGKWTPSQVLELGDDYLKAAGLELPARTLWDPEKGEGLLSAAIWVDGCSAAFVSKTGLLVTNHHCLFSILQEHSTPSRNLIDEGFLAKTPEEELRGKTERIRVMRGFTDVTAQMLAAVPEGADDLTRAKALERRSSELVIECEKRPATRCQVAAYDGGVQYLLVDALELSDLRLVYAPPRGVGEFGGEVDNWMWPRHTGDFAIARAYAADGRPFEPKHIFPIAKKGVGPGDFVMVMGYPGVTFRALTAAEMEGMLNGVFGARRDVYGDWIAQLERVTDAKGRIAVADELKSMHNRYKNARGQFAGFARGSLLQKQQAEEAQVVQWGQQKLAEGEDPMLRAALAARDELERSAKGEQQGAVRDFLLGHFSPFSGITPSKALFWPTTLIRAAQQRELPDLEREESYQERNLPRVKDKLERDQLRYFEAADQALTVDLVRRALALPPEARIASIDRAFGEVKPGDLPGAVALLYQRSKVTDPAARAKMWTETPEQLRARRDPLLELGFAFAEDVAAWEKRKLERIGEISRLRPTWRRAVMAWAGRPIAPDANRTLRVSFARVRGYSPRDGLFALPFTTLSGVIAKAQPTRPFIVPEKIQTAYREGRFGPWRDPALGEVPVDFLSDADTTGGNSGSPTVNARGELVGVNFDRVWENVANDFGYNPEVARNISADVRYLLWILDQVENADGLLRELGIRD